MPVTPVPISKTATIAPTADTTTATTQPVPTGWTVDTSDVRRPCPHRTADQRHRQDRLGDAIVWRPSAAFRPVKDGFQLYLKIANDKGLLPGYKITTDIRDDQYDSDKNSRRRRWIDR